MNKDERAKELLKEMFSLMSANLLMEIQDMIDFCIAEKLAENMEEEIG